MNQLPGFYRTVDPIDNLVIRVNLRKVANAAQLAAGLPLGGALGSTVQVATSMRHGSAAEAAAPPRLPAAIDDTLTERVVEFSWQQKVFGPGELLKYAHALDEDRAGRRPPGGHTPLAREYMSAVAEHLDAGEPIFDAVSSIMLYTYTDRDGYVPPWETLGGEVDGSSSSGGQGQDSRSGRRAGVPEASGLARALSQPLREPQSAIAHVYREKPYTVMHVMAAVGVSREAYKARTLEPGTIFEIPLVSIKYHATPSQLRAGVPLDSALLEVRPGFAEPLPVDVSVARAALAAGVTAQTAVGPGRYGGDIKLRLLRGVPSMGSSGGAADGELLPFGLSAGMSLPGEEEVVTPPAPSAAAVGDTTALDLNASSASALNRSGFLVRSSVGGGAPAASPGALAPPVLATLVELHSFAGPDGARYEYCVTNPDEDAVAAALVSAASTGAFGLKGAIAAGVAVDAGLSGGWSGGAVDAVSMPSLLGLPASSAPEALATALAKIDPLKALEAAQRRVLEARAHRAAADFLGALVATGAAAVRAAALAAPLYRQVSPSYPLPLHPSSFRVDVFLELVAAARFEGPSSVYVAWEVAVPRGNGWKLLAPAGEGAAASGQPCDVEVVPFQGEGGRAAAAAARRKRLAAGAASPGLRRRKGEEAEATGLQDDEEEEGAVAESNGTSSSTLTPPGVSAFSSPVAPSAYVKCPGLSGVTQLARFKQKPWRFGEAEELAAATAANNAAFVTPQSPAPSLAQQVGSGQRAPVAAGLLRPAPTPVNSLVTASSVDGHSVPGWGDDGPSYGGQVVATDDFVTLEEVDPAGAGAEVDVPLASALMCRPRGAGCGGAARVPVAALGYPIEARFLFDAGACSALANEGPASPLAGGVFGPMPPVLFLTVGAVDRWGRHTVEGYGAVPLPVLGAPGHTDLKVRTWRPVSSLRSAEADFFVGSATRLQDEDVAWTALPGKTSATGPAALHEAATASVSRLGMATVTAGEVGLRVDTVVTSFPAPLLRVAAQCTPTAVAVREEVNKKRLKSVADILLSARALRNATLRRSAMPPPGLTAAAAAAAAGASADA